MKRFLAVLLCLLMCVSMLPVTAFADGPYTVSFNMNGHGNQIVSQTVEEGGTATKPEDPTETGYQFDGWYNESACTTEFSFSTPISTDKTIYAKWTTLYKVDFNMNGHGTGITDQYVVPGGTATKPADPTETGYQFDGWYNEPACTTGFSFSTPISTDKTLYAKWTTLYKVDFNMNGHGTGITDQYVVPGGTATKPADPTETGYQFDGWYNESACTTEFSFSTPISTDKTIYAKWTTLYKVDFNMNGHGTGITDQYVVPGGTATKPADPTETGYQFDGWYNEPACTTGFSFSTTISTDKTLYAKWTKLNKVTFNMNGHGATIKDQYVVPGGTVTKPVDPTETGYQFGGWYNESACTTEFSFSTTINSDKTLYAKWTKAYKVTFDTVLPISTIANIPSPQSVAPNGKVTKPTAPSDSSQHHEFLGWYKDSLYNTKFDFDKDTITNNTTLYAKWKHPYDDGVCYYCWKAQPSFSEVVQPGYKAEIIRGVYGRPPAVAHYGSSHSFKVDTYYYYVEESVTVRIDGNKITLGKDYKLDPGSTIVTLRSSFIRKLAVGDHSVAIETNTAFGTAKGTFRVSNSPKTGDDSNVALWVTVGVISAAGVAGIAYYLLKKRKK